MCGRKGRILPHGSGRKHGSPALGPNAQLSADGLGRDGRQGDCEELLGGPAGINFLPFIFGAYDELEAACSPDDNPFRSNDNGPERAFDRHGFRGVDGHLGLRGRDPDYRGGRTTPPRR